MEKYKKERYIKNAAMERQYDNHRQPIRVQFLDDSPKLINLYL